MKLFVGIDISSKDLVTSMISEETTEIVFQGNFVNDLKGATELKNTIINTPNSNHLDQVVIGMEATSIYSFHPAMFFQENLDLRSSIRNQWSSILRRPSVIMTSSQKTRTIKLMLDFLRVGRYSTGIKTILPCNV